MMSETGDRKSTENERNFTQLRTINKMCKLYANRLARYLCVDIKSSQDSQYWAQTVPNVQNLRVLNTQISIPLKNARRVTFYCYEFHKENILSLNSTVIQSWDWSFLEYLAILKTRVTESQIQTIGCKFPHLKALRLRALLDNENFVISNFLELKEMQLNFAYTFAKKAICITNLPNLTRCIIENLNKLEFRNVPQLKYLEAIESSSIIFHDDVECIETITVGDLYEIDPFNHVKWEKLKILFFGYTKGCQTLCLALRDVKSLRISKVNDDVPNINWSNLNHLTDLLWEFPSFERVDTREFPYFGDMTSNFASLRSLYLIWYSPYFDLLKMIGNNTMKNVKFFTLSSDFPILVDCQHILQVFPCIQDIRLVDENNIACSNFESLFQISTLGQFTGEWHREKEIKTFWKEHPGSRGTRFREIEEMEEFNFL
jgi:hypothetical protein